MRYLLILAAVFAFVGCHERDQFAADQLARHQAISLDIAQVHDRIWTLHQSLIEAKADPGIIKALEDILPPLQKAEVLNRSATESLPGVSGVTLEDIKAKTPTHSAESLADHPENDTPAPAPKGINWGAVGAVGLGALLVLQKVGPMLPYVGPLFSAFKPLQPLLDMAWKAGSHVDTVASDKAKDTVASSASALLELLTLAKADPTIAARIPPNVDVALKTLSG